MNTKQYPLLPGYETAARDTVDAYLARPALKMDEEATRQILKDLQANILKHHSKTHTEHFFITFSGGKTEEVKKWLARIGQKTTTARDQLLEGHKDTTNILCVYLTYAGYQYLGIPDSVMPDGLAFKMGLLNRVQLGKDALQDELSDVKQVHAVLLYAYATQKLVGKRKSQLESDLPDIMDDLKALEKRPAFVQTGTLKNPLPKAYHFQEGAGNPRFFPGISPVSNRLPLKPSEIAPLSLVLVQDRGGNHPHSCGSFGAFMKLDINESAMHQLESEIATQAAANNLKLHPELIKAKIVGRFLDGTPLSLSDRPVRNNTNDFDFNELVKLKRARGMQNDDSGSRCPFHAHIRKANPRLPDTQDIRIVRRGVFYEEKDQEKGLLFLSFQSSLENKFEYILNNWMLNRYTHSRDAAGNLISVETGQDILFSQAHAEYKIPAVWNENKDKKDIRYIPITVPEQIVTLKGGLYFFAPSRSFFSKLVRPPKVSHRGAVLPGTPVKKNGFIPGTVISIKKAPESGRKSLFIKNSEIIFEYLHKEPD
ncbi:MAG: Dyp-type peroxidase [Saprospiraceae bacterium]|nr:Dyp-type peroxidase [Saprospiraceae bacterium]